MEDSQHSALTKEGVVESLHVCISVRSFHGRGLEYMCSLFLEDTKRRVWSCVYSTGNDMLYRSPTIEGLRTVVG